MKLLGTIAASSVLASSAWAAKRPNNQANDATGSCDDLANNPDNMPTCLSDILEALENMSKGKMGNRMEKGIRAIIEEVMTEKMGSMAAGETSMDNAADRPNKGDYMEKEDMNMGMGGMGMNPSSVHVEGNLIINNGQAQYDMSNGDGEKPMKDEMYDMDEDKMTAMFERKFYEYNACTEKINMRIWREMKAKLEGYEEDDTNMAATGDSGKYTKAKRPNKENGSQDGSDMTIAADGTYEKEEMAYEKEDMAYDKDPWGLEGPWAWESIDQFWEENAGMIANMGAKQTEEVQQMWEEHFDMYKDQETKELMAWMLPYISHMEFKYCQAMPMTKDMEMEYGMGGDKMGYEKEDYEKEMGEKEDYEKDMGYENMENREKY